MAQTTPSINAGRKRKKKKKWKEFQAVVIHIVVESNSSLLPMSVTVHEILAK